MRSVASGILTGGREYGQIPGRVPARALDTPRPRSEYRWRADVCRLAPRLRVGPRGRRVGGTRFGEGRRRDGGGTMASKKAQELGKRMDAAWENLSRQLHGMDAHLERSDAPGEWTAREILSHLLLEPGFDPVQTLGRFAE